MPRPLCTSLLALAVAFAANGQPARADFVIGSTLTLNATNAPDSFTANLSLTPGTVTVDNGALDVTISIYNAGPDSQWVDVGYQTTNNAPISSDINGGWELSISGFQTDVPAVIPEFYGYWTVNGTAISTINGVSGSFLPFVGQNPVDPSLGPVFLNFYNPPSGFTTSSPLYTELYPYSYISNFGVDPSTANGFHMGFLETPEAVPEPSSVVLVGLGLAGVLARWRMTRRRA